MGARRKRMPADRRRELWREPLPAAELAGRLRTLPLFASVSVDELFRSSARHTRCACTIREHSAEGGHGAAQPASSSDGTVVATLAAEAERHVIEPPSAIGFNEALQGSPCARRCGRKESRSRWCSRSRSSGRCSPTTPISSAVCSPRCQADPEAGPGAADFRGRRARAAGSWGSHADREGPRAAEDDALQPHLCRRDAAGCRCDDYRHHDRGIPALPESAPAALWMILSGEVSLTGSAFGRADSGTFGRHHRIVADAERPAARIGRHGRDGRRGAAHRAGRAVRCPRGASGASPPDVRRHVPPHGGSRVRLRRLQAQSDAVGSRYSVVGSRSPSSSRFECPFASLEH